MVSLPERVHRSIHRDCLLPPGARVLAAVSGGADSTALAHLLRELSASDDVALRGLAHVNHGLRGAEGDADEAFCRELAERMGLPFEVEAVDARREARRLGTSVEDAGRRLRYGFLAAAAERIGASHVAVGHTLDDQAETVLLALVRGAGPRGLGGMRARRGTIVRPLLGVTHAEILGWLEERGLPYREDASNLDRRYLRNRVRHELIPLLRARFSPAVVTVLARSAAIWQADSALLEELAGQAFERCARRAGGRVLLDRAALAALPLALRRRVARLALAEAGGGRFAGFDHADRLLRLAEGTGGRRLAFPGQEAEVVGGDLVLAGAWGRAAGPALNFLPAPLSIPGEVILGATGLALTAERRAGAAALAASPGDPRTATLDAATVSGLFVRTRRPGDRFRPLGLTGRKKLQDFFVDRKVPREERDRVPIVVDGAGRIVWVAGHEIAEDFRVSQGTHDVVILKLRGERV